MYGLVFRGLEDLVCSKWGQDTWAHIKWQAQVNVEVFVHMDEYPDEMLLRLVAKVAEMSQMTPDRILRQLGQHWALYTATEVYGPLIEQSGGNFAELLMGLNALHDRIGQMYPHLSPPQYVFSDVMDNSLIMHYHSHRKGLVPLVIGTVEGLAMRWQLQLTIVPQLQREQGATHDSFLLSWCPLTEPVTSIHQEVKE